MIIYRLLKALIKAAEEAEKTSKDFKDLADKLHVAVDCGEKP